MENENKDYSRNFFFRLIKVAYILGLLAIWFIIIFVGWTEKPTPYLDSEKSLISCANGKSYTLDKAKIYLFYKTENLDQNDEIEARKLCAYGVINDYSSEYRNLQIPQSKNYSLKQFESIRGSWTTLLLIWVLGISISYIVLSLIRETLNYIFLGKSFDGNWFFIPLGFIVLITESAKDSKQ